MEKRTILAILISIVFIVAWEKFVVKKFYPAKTVKEVAVEKTVNDNKPAEKGPVFDQKPVQSTKKAEDTHQVESTDNGSLTAADVSPNAGAADPDLIEVSEPEQIVVLENKELTLKFTNMGGRLISVKLNDYTDDEGVPVELVNPYLSKKDLTPLSFEGIHAGLNEKGFLVEKTENTVVFTLKTKAGLVRKRFELLKNYQLKVDISAAGLNKAEISLGPGINTAEQSNNRYSTEDTVVVFTDGKIDRISKKKLEDKSIVSAGTQWVAVEDKYFAKIWLPDSTGENILGRKQTYTNENKDFTTADVVLEGSNIAGTMYMGPKSYDGLKTIGHHYEKIVNFGFFGIFSKWLFIALKWLNGLIGNYGWSIILLTILIRLLIYPVSHAGLKSMKEMQRVQPKMKEIQAKYKKYGNDLSKKQEMNKEIQELYKKEGVNPLGGCLPMLLQMPIFFAFWSLLLNVIELRHAGFMFWIHDLSAFDPYYVLPVLMGITQLISQVITPSTGDANQRRMMYLLPIVFTVFLAKAPSGLIVYWTTNNLFQIVQQFLINRSLKEAA